MQRKQATETSPKTATTDGRRARGDRTRRRVLDAAVMQASRFGLEGLTIGTVAQGAAVSKGAITVLFGDKEALQLATLEDAVARFRAELERVDVAGKSRVHVLAAFFERWFDFVKRKKLPGGCFLHAATSEYRARPGVVRDRISEHRQRWRDTVKRLLIDARDAGELEAGTDVDQLAFELLACQAAADCADLYGDGETFERAHRTVKERLTVRRRKR
ncbi:Transcriptional regulator, TetR family [Labilithrix luteola]|uniref:Transcriptional regulator, TetR family n=1 Tax=Labilithrix luteola TaxID=1391654 RepID=A0A0K1PQS8_9BACT|nr:TetR/AcrR family transcriptional regulator [Labilithrix luteola]AKU95721.1 Transcriptional regulator, TetR family [Labilithrix luteola]